MGVECSNKLIVRVANEDDWQAINDIVDNYDGLIPYDINKTKDSLKKSLSMQGIALAEYNGQIVGGVSGYMALSLFQEEIVFIVMFLIFKPEYRYLTKLFIKELELMLLTTRCTQIVYGVPASMPVLERFFGIMGYEKLETHYMKRLSGSTGSSGSSRSSRGNK